MSDRCQHCLILILFDRNNKSFFDIIHYHARLIQTIESALQNNDNVRSVVTLLSFTPELPESPVHIYTAFLNSLTEFKESTELDINLRSPKQFPFTGDSFFLTPEAN